MKHCPSCNTEKENSAFSKDASRKDGCYPICKDCRNSHQRDAYASDVEFSRKKQRDYYWRNPEGQYRRQKKYESSNRERVLEARKQTRLSLKQEALNAYGGVCECCGESAQEFLAIDHINGGGSQERQNGLKGGVHLYRRLKREGWPKGYRVLCHNCNQSIGMYGYCPHQNLVINLFKNFLAKVKE